MSSSEAGNKDEDEKRDTYKIANVYYVLGTRKPRLEGAGTTPKCGHPSAQSRQWKAQVWHKAGELSSK